MIRALMASGLAVLLLAAGAGQLRAATFDAIAIDDTTNGAGGTGEYALGAGDTAQEAQRIAMKNCRLGGNTACTLKLTFQRCGAYASAGPVSGTGTGDNKGQAAAAALAACGAGACRLVVVDCVGQMVVPLP